MGNAVGAEKARALGTKWKSLLGKRIRIVDDRTGIGYKVWVVGEKYVYGHHLVSVASKIEGETGVFFRVSPVEVESAVDVE